MSSQYVASEAAGGDGVAEALPIPQLDMLSLIRNAPGILSTHETQPPRIAEDRGVPIVLRDDPTDEVILLRNKFREVNPQKCAEISLPVANIFDYFDHYDAQVHGLSILHAVLVEIDRDNRRRKELIREFVEDWKQKNLDRFNAMTSKTATLFEDEEKMEWDEAFLNEALEDLKASKLTPSTIVVSKYRRAATKVDSRCLPSDSAGNDYRSMVSTQRVPSWPSKSSNFRQVMEVDYASMNNDRNDRGSRRTSVGQGSAYGSGGTATGDRASTTRAISNPVEHGNMSGQWRPRNIEATNVNRTPQVQVNSDFLESENSSSETSRRANTADSTRKIPGDQSMYWSNARPPGSFPATLVPHHARMMGSQETQRLASHQAPRPIYAKRLNQNQRYTLSGDNNLQMQNTPMISGFEQAMIIDPSQAPIMIPQILQSPVSASSNLMLQHPYQGASVQLANLGPASSTYPMPMLNLPSAQIHPHSSAPAGGQPIWVNQAQLSPAVSNHMALYEPNGMILHPVPIPEAHGSLGHMKPQRPLQQARHRQKFRTDDARAYENHHMAGNRRYSNDSRHDHAEADFRPVGRGNYNKSIPHGERSYRGGGRRSSNSEHFVSQDLGPNQPPTLHTHSVLPSLPPTNECVPHQINATAEDRLQKHYERSSQKLMTAISGDNRRPSGSVATREIPDHQLWPGQDTENGIIRGATLGGQHGYPTTDWSIQTPSTQIPQLAAHEDSDAHLRVLKLGGRYLDNVVVQNLCPQFGPMKCLTPISADWPSGQGSGIGMSRITHYYCLIEYQYLRDAVTAQAALNNLLSNDGRDALTAHQVDPAWVAVHLSQLRAYRGRRNDGHPKSYGTTGDRDPSALSAGMRPLAELPRSNAPNVKPGMIPQGSAKATETKQAGHEDAKGSSSPASEPSVPPTTPRKRSPQQKRERQRGPKPGKGSSSFRSTSPRRKGSWSESGEITPTPRGKSTTTRKKPLNPPRDAKENRVPQPNFGGGPAATEGKGKSRSSEASSVPPDSSMTMDLPSALHMVQGSVDDFKRGAGGGGALSGRK